MSGQIRGPTDSVQAEILRSNETSTTRCIMYLLPLVILMIQPGDPQLMDAVNGHASSVTAIQTVYGELVLRITPAGQQEPSLSYSAKYWREPGLVRVRQTCDLGLVGQVI